MKKILLTHSYILRFDPKQWQTGKPYAPLGTLYAASLLRKNGYGVQVFDSMFVKSPEELRTVIHREQPEVLVIYDDGFNYLTKMCLTNMREAAFAMIRMGKENNCQVIVSSSDSTDHFDLYLEQGADYILLGEAEMTLLELLKSEDEAETGACQVQGLVYREKGSYVKTASRPILKNLDQLPFPAWDLIDMEPYRNAWLRHAGYFSMNMATTRGCPFKCNWCAKPIYGNRYNSRSVANVVEELRFLKKKYQFDHIWFCDDIFGLKPGWVTEFASVLSRDPIDFKFKIQARADLLVQEDYIMDLARAGCENVWMGAESGSQHVLDAMDKGIRVEDIYQSTRLLKRFGVRPSFFIQFGYPGETREDITQTIRMINELLPSEIGISVSYPLPGTRFYERVKAELKQKANWTDSDELQLMFKNTFQPAFYKQLHRYVHRNLHKHLAWAQLKRAIRNPVGHSLSFFKKVAALVFYVPAVFIEKLKLDSLQKDAL